MRARLQTTSILAAATLALAGIIPASSAAAPDPAYTVTGELAFTEEELPLTAVAHGALDGSTLYLNRRSGVLAVDLETNERRIVGADLAGSVNDVAAYDGELYVLTRSPGALHVFDQQGAFVRTVDTGPHTILDTSRLDVAPDGTIFLLGVQRSAGGVLLRIDPEGSLTPLLPAACDGWEFVDDALCPGHLDIAVDAEHVFITDNAWRAIRVFDHEGAHLATIGEPQRQGVTLGSWEVSTDHEGLLYARAAHDNVIEVLEVGSAVGGAVTLTPVARLPLTYSSTPRLRGGFAAPVVTPTGQVILSNASGSSLSRGDVLLLEPVRQAWRDPSVEGVAEAGRSVTADLGLWPTGYGEVTLQWLEDGAEVPGATTETFALLDAHVGAEIAVQVTVDYGAAGTRTATSAPVTVSAPPPPPAPEPEPAKASVELRLVHTPVSRSAKPRVRVEVSAADEANPSARIIVRSGAKQLASVALTAGYRGSRTIVLPRLKVGKHRITASFSGSHVAPTSAAKTLRVTKAKPKVKLKLAPKVRVGSRAKATVRVKVVGIAKPTGKLVFKDGKKKIKVVKLKAKHRGKITVRIPRLAAGKHKITVTYQGTKQIKKKTSKASTLRVR